MRIPYDAWVLIADGEKFILLRNEGDTDYPNLRVVTHDEIRNPPTREQGTDRPGRYEDAGVGKSAVEQTDWHWLEKERFIKDLAEKLVTGAKVRAGAESGDSSGVEFVIRSGYGRFVTGYRCSGY